MAHLPQPQSSQGPALLETETSNQMFKTEPGVQGCHGGLKQGRHARPESCMGRRASSVWGGVGTCHPHPRAGWAVVPGAVGGGCPTTSEDIWWHLAKPLILACEEHMTTSVS